MFYSDSDSDDELEMKRPKTEQSEDDQLDLVSSDKGSDT